MIKKAMLYYQTLKYLQWKQIKYRLLYQFIPPKFPQRELEFKALRKREITFEKSIVNRGTWLGNNTFRFLNLEYDFQEKIDWNFNRYGKLWTYNLCYFEYLGQANISRDEGLRLILDFISNEKNILDGLEPFPVSLRIINWIKFIYKYQINDPLVDQAICRKLLFLSKRLEYHLLGNHLLENAFALLFGAFYCADQNIFKQAASLLYEELNNQILSDGAHFELSPMYHQLILYRLLDVLNLLQNENEPDKKELKKTCTEKAGLMIGWLQQITFENGAIPRVNDTAIEIAPTTECLIGYAEKLQIKTDKIIPLGASGYRKVLLKDYELLLDVGNIGPDYIPGHAHADTLNFILHYNKKPAIVDTGISTYEKNQQRYMERSTQMHNTVVVEKTDQSEVWGGFRVGRRAKVENLIEQAKRISASHDGYKHLGVIHERSFVWTEQFLTITDTLSKECKAEAHIHFHPSVKLEIENDIVKTDFGLIKFKGNENLRLESYQYAQAFNILLEANKIVIPFSNVLTTKIILQ